MVMASGKPEAMIVMIEKSDRKRIRRRLKAEDCA